MDGSALVRGGESVGDMLDEAQGALKVERTLAKQLRKVASLLRSQEGRVSAEFPRAVLPEAGVIY